MITVKVIGIQQARAALEKHMREAAGASGITVGIHEGSGVHPGTNKRPGTGETVAEVGAKNHFGIGVPARPWLDVGLESAKPEIQRLVKKHGSSIPREDLMNMIGGTAKDAVQNYITELKSPPNSAETIAAKGSSNPLIDSGIMKGAVTYEITPSLPTEGIG